MKYGCGRFLGYKESGKEVFCNLDTDAFCDICRKEKQRFQELNK